MRVVEMIEREKIADIVESRGEKSEEVEEVAFENKRDGTESSRDDLSPADDRKIMNENKRDCLEGEI